MKSYTLSQKEAAQYDSKDDKDERIYHELREKLDKDHPNQEIYHPEGFMIRGIIEEDKQ